MQAALQDLSRTGTQTQSFVICQRVLHECHEVIFGDLPPPATVPYASLNIVSQLHSTRKKVRPHYEPALVGMGMILAGAPGLPQITEVIGDVAIEQGRVQGERHEPQRLTRQEDDTVRRVTPVSSTEEEDDDDDNDLDDDSAEGIESFEVPNSRHSRQATDMDSFHHQTTSSHRKTISAARTSPALPLYMKNIQKPRLSDDPLGQNDPEPHAKSPSPFQSSPSIPSSRFPNHSSTLSGADLLLQRYDLLAQNHLLRSQYCRSEVSRNIDKIFLAFIYMPQVQFLLTLENISNRLLVVPRPARVSALRAELTALNHKLPAEVNIMTTLRNILPISIN